jgi:glutamine synthetase
MNDLDQEHLREAGGDGWQAHLRDHGVTVVELWIPDINGSVKGKWYPVDSFREMAESVITFPDALLSWTRDALMYDDIPYSNPGMGFPDLAVAPDLSTLRALPWRAGHAAVLGHIQTLDGGPISVDPRQVLLRQVDGHAGLGLEPRCSLEYEFSLLNPDGTPTNLRHEGYDFVLPETISRFLDALTVQLVQFGLPVAVAHTEWGFGQIELTLRPLPAAVAADSAVRLKAAVKSIAHEMNLIASFMAKPFPEQPGNGLHVNISLQEAGGQNVFADPNKHAKLIGRYLGGVLATMGEFSILGASTINAYKRRTGGQFAPATATWSRTNRTASVRALLDRGAPSRIEFRASGADSNPYLGLAAVLAGGLHGLREDVPSPPELEGSGYNVSDATLQLPSSLPEALSLFAGSPIVKAALGEEFVDHYATLIGHEVRDFAAAVTDWERERYLRYS